jgi:predicted phage tail component-like protein
MSYNVTYNGQILDDIISGYQTLNIAGRGLLGRALDTVIVAGRVGDVVLGQRVPPRDITVYYLIKSASNQDMQESLELLHMALSSEDDVTFQFGDEEYYRIGRLASAENPPYDSYSGVGSFTIHCQDPYKYKEMPALSGTNITLPETSNDGYRLDQIDVTFTLLADGFSVKNVTTGRSIILLGDFLAGDTLRITDKGIWVNDEPAMDRLDFVNSDWQEFKLNAGDKITTAKSMTMKVSERAL